MQPAHAHVSGEEQGGVDSDQRRAGTQWASQLEGHRFEELTPTWQPHFYYQPHFTSGIVRQSFDVWVTQDAQFFTEWRDEGAYPGNFGPSVQFDGSGVVRVAGEEVAKFPLEAWLHVEIRAVIGRRAAEDVHS